jgi:peptidoglycan-associated lipoprotein
MMDRKNVIRSLMLITLPLMLVGCGNPESSGKKPSGKKYAAAMTFPASEMKRYAQGIEKQLSGHKTLQFGLDKDELGKQDKIYLQALAQHAIKKNRVVRVEGYTCELGGAEYNIALGFKRAQSVGRYLRSLGVPEDSIILVSYGKEKPVAGGHTMADWAKNRRAEISY